METGEGEMELITSTYFYDNQVCKILHLLVCDLLKEITFKKKKKKQNRLDVTHLLFLNKASIIVHLFDSAFKHCFTV